MSYGMSNRRFKELVWRYEHLPRTTYTESGVAVYHNVPLLIDECIGDLSKITRSKFDGNIYLIDLPEGYE